MGDFFKIVDPAPPSGKAGDLPIFAQGDSWMIVRGGSAYVLSYVSGELSGREKAIIIDEADARRLAAGETDIDAVLIAYGVS